MQELDAYDAIGMEYYYLRDIDKAIFYHNRMMKGELEKMTVEKRWNLDVLERSRQKCEYRKNSGLKTVFEIYKENKEKMEDNNEIELPHENAREVFV